MNLVKRLGAVVAAWVALCAHANYTDLWYNAQESGWGANVVQQEETAFVTLFVYGRDGAPTWYVASDARVIAYMPGALPLFTGTLYRTRGPWHGGPFDPSRVSVTPVGTVWLEALAKDRMRITYDVEGDHVVREVVRQTWAVPLTGGFYTATFSLRQAPSPSGTPFGTLQFHAEMLVHLDDGSAFLRADDSLGRRCEYRGAHRQAGKLATVTGEFTCDAGAHGAEAMAGTFEITELEVTAHGITGYLRTTSPSRVQYGRFGAALL
jgi:hypothetical protein